MKLNIVHHMDNLAGMSMLPPKCANLIISDPPYFEVKGDFDFEHESWDCYLEFMEEQAKAYHRIMADNGTLFIYGHALKIAYIQVIFDKYFSLENSLVWEKKECQQRRNEPGRARRFAPVTERILMYSNEHNQEECSAKNSYAFETGKRRTEIMEPIVGYLIGEMERAGLTPAMINEATGTCMASHWFTRTSQWALPTAEWYEKLRMLFAGGYLKREYEDLKREYEDLKREYEDLRRPFNQFALQTDVLLFGQESHITKGFDHDTKKPETLTRVLILTCSRKGDLVVVPFAGSGTECAMAAKEGRRFVGFDINEKYVRMSNERVKKTINAPTLFDHLPAEQTKLF